MICITDDSDNSYEDLLNDYLPDKHDMKIKMGENAIK